MSREVLNVGQVRIHSGSVSKEDAMREAADEMGVADTFRKTPVGVLFGEDDSPEQQGRTVADPYFGGAGPTRTTCTECGNCMVGCRVGAKNTLVKNYLALAEGLGVQIVPMRTVTRVGVKPCGSTMSRSPRASAMRSRV